MQAMCRFIPLPFAEWILCQHSKKQKKSDPMLCSLFRNRFPLSDNGIRCFHAYTNIYYMMWCIFAEKSPETWGQLEGKVLGVLAPQFSLFRNRCHLIENGIQSSQAYTRISRVSRLGFERASLSVQDSSRSRTRIRNSGMLKNRTRSRTRHYVYCSVNIRIGT